MKRSRPTALSSLLEQALARFGLDRRLDDYRVWQAWDEVVGRTISRNAQPVRLDGSRLVVAVRTSTWMHELSLLQREIVPKLNAWMGREVVREIFLVVGRVDAPAQEGAAKPPSKPAPPLRPGSAQAPSADDLPPEAAAIFRRWWRASRGGPPGRGNPGPGQR